MLSEQERWDALAAAFGTLGRLHRQSPDRETLAALRGLLDEWPLPHTDDARAGLDRMRRSAELHETVEAIRSDHDRLYGVSATAAVAPYESVQRGIDRLVFDQETHVVRAVYRRFGLSAPNLHREPDDHIGLEFDFVAHLMLRVLDEVSRDPGDPQVPLSAARAFLDEHLLMWAPAMLAEAVSLAHTEFMAGVALLSRGALESADATIR